ncbi:hypothetical protein, partial [Acinetobacter baumannii]|uniref:hypothetical protein n=1 Tax=Acinetobacter baumannii TaxID=470 RepID=UPI001D17B22E
ICASCSSSVPEVTLSLLLFAKSQTCSRQAARRSHGTQHKRLAVALPPVFDLRQLFFFSTRGHAVTPFIR